MKVIFFGTPSYVDPVIHSLQENFDLVKIIREKQNFDKKTIEDLKSLSPDFFVVAAYGVILPKTILEIPKFGAINIHPSLLPRYRGATPIQSAIIAGDKKTGVSLILMDALMDHGEVISQFEEDIKESDTFETLSKRLFEKSAKVLVDTLKNSNKRINGKKQDEGKATFTKTLTKNDGYTDINNPPEKDLLLRMIRAYYPWPSVWTRFDLAGKEVIIKLLPEGRIQVEGKKAMSYKDFINGYQNAKVLLDKLGLN